MRPSRPVAVARQRPVPSLVPAIPAIAAIAAILSLLLAGAAHAQAAVPAYQVRIDSVNVGTAAAVANLPVEGVPSTQSTATTVPPHQAAAATQTSVVVATRDAGLLAVLRGWVASNNSGSKNTVQPKTVEIDQVLPTGGPLRYVLHDAWPSNFAAPGPDGTVMVTIIYQRAEILHQ